MNKTNTSQSILSAALLIAGLMGGLPLVRAAGTVPDSETVNKLLSEAKTMSYQLQEDATTMESFSRMNVSWESHAAAINQIKNHINALTKQAAKLREASASASPWQKAAITRITPYLDELGGYTAAVIEHINGEKKHSLADYKDYLEANADYASDLATVIADFVDYGKTKSKVERLGAKLEIPAGK